MRSGVQIPPPRLQPSRIVEFTIREGAAFSLQLVFWTTDYTAIFRVGSDLLPTTSQKRLVSPRNANSTIGYSELNAEYVNRTVTFVLPLGFISCQFVSKTVTNRNDAKHLERPCTTLNVECDFARAGDLDHILAAIRNQ